MGSLLARKKVRSDNFISFKNISNKQQFESEISDLLATNSKAIKLSDAEKAKESLREAQDKIIEIR